MIYIMESDLHITDEYFLKQAEILRYLKELYNWSNEELIERIKDIGKFFSEFVDKFRKIPEFKEFLKFLKDKKYLENKKNKFEEEFIRYIYINRRFLWD